MTVLGIYVHWIGFKISSTDAGLASTRGGVEPEQEEPVVGWSGKDLLGPSSSPLEPFDMGLGRPWVRSRSNSWMQGERQSSRDHDLF